MAERLVLAYSGGLDTTVATRWLTEKGYEVIALTVDVGLDRDREEIQARALAAGAVKFVWRDARDSFLRDYAFRALMAGAAYQGHYPLATALSRPLIAKLLVETARQEEATAVAHGCTGKGNDQVRFDVSVQALAPDLRIVAPVREWDMDREEEVRYAQERDLPIPLVSKSPYSVDANLWGRSIECGPLEDPWQEPPEDAFQWTLPPERWPDRPTYVEVTFREGEPVALDGHELSPTELVQRLNQLGGEHGVGRIDMVEDRLVGIKTREVYEAPAAVILLTAHEALEQLTLSRQQRRFKAQVAQEYAELVYYGLWFTRHRQDLDAYVRSTQRYVSGTVRMKLFRGQAVAVGRRSPHSLYDFSLATYEAGDRFDHRASPGFIHIWGLPVRVQSQVQGLEE